MRRARWAHESFAPNGWHGGAHLAIGVNRGGRPPALELIMTGDPIPSARAYQLGMVNQVVPPAEVMPAALALAQRVVAAAPIAVQHSRRVAIRAFTDDDEALWKAGGRGFAEVAKTEDYREGPTAFIEKRAPQWKGR